MEQSEVGVDGEMACPADRYAKTSDKCYLLRASATTIMTYRNACCICYTLLCRCETMAKRKNRRFQEENESGHAIILEVILRPLSLSKYANAGLKYCLPFRQIEYWDKLKI